MPDLNLHVCLSGVLLRQTFYLHTCEVSYQVVDTHVRTRYKD